MVWKRTVAAAKKRIFEEEWGFDPSTLTKTELTSQLLAHECTIATRRRTGDFKTSDKKQSLVDLLYTKLSVPPPHVSMTDFLETVTKMANGEGDAAVRAMASTSTGAGAAPARQMRARAPVSTKSVSSDSDKATSDSEDSEDRVIDTVIAKRIGRKTRVEVRRTTPSSSSESEDSEDKMSLTDILKGLKRKSSACERKDSALGETESHVDKNSDRSSWKSDTDSSDRDTDDTEESTEDEEGIVNVGDRFVLSDDEEGDSTLTVRRIVHGGIVYVHEDDETCCLSYVRRKVSMYEDT